MSLKYLKSFLIFIFTFCSSLVFAELPQEDTFGPEWTLSGPGGKEIYGTEMDVLNMHMRHHLFDNQPEGEKFKIYSSTLKSEGMKYVSPEGWWVFVKKDLGSIEINAKAMTVAEWKKFSSNIQDAVFASASNVDLYPALYRGGGHISIGTQKFSPLLFRNFIVDFINHNELAMGVFSYDYRNQQPMDYALKASQQQKNFLAVLEKFDSGDLEKENTLQSLFYLKYKRLAKPGELLHYALDPILFSTRKAIYSRAFGETLIENSRIEIRSFRPQASMDVYVRQIELLQARLNYLRKLDKPIPYKPLNRIEEKGNQETPPIDPQEALQSFYRYVDESGLSWQDHRDYMWPQWMNAGGARDEFESSAWFIEREWPKVAANCGALLR